METKREPKIMPGKRGIPYASAPRSAIHDVLIIRANEIVDDRGSLTEFWSNRLPEVKSFLGQIVHSYVSWNSYGVVRAWHYHLNQRDLWFVPPGSGKIQVGLYDARADSPTRDLVQEVIMGGGNVILLGIPEGVYHGYTTLSSPGSSLINSTNQPYDATDEYRLDYDTPLIPFRWGTRNR